MSDELQTAALPWGNILDIFLGFAEENNIKTAWHSFIQIPNAHRFGTYHVPETDFDGPDLTAGEKWLYGDLYLFYKDTKTADDTALEEELEHDLRAAAKFRKTCGFDDSHGLFYSRYSFLCHEFLRLN